MEIEVRPVEGRRERKLFLEFPWTIYRSSPQWVPPLRQNQKEMVGYARHPFFAEAEIQTWLAWKGSEVVGRIASIVNQAHNRFYKEKRGFFGFFETIDDERVSHALFDAARDWVQQRGMAAMRGPVNPSMNHESALLIDGFDKPPTFMMPYNLPYYQRLVESYGFQKVQDLYSFWGTIDMLPQVEKRLVTVISRAEEIFKIQLRPLNTKHFQKEIELFLDIYNKSMETMWGFVPMSVAEMRYMASQMKHMIIPELTVIAEADGVPIGALFVLPDYNPRIKKIDGKLFPFGFMTLLSRKRDFRRVRIISANVMPEYQMWGVGVVLLKGMVPKLLDLKVHDVEFSWVAESNTLSRGSLAKGGAMIEKTHRVYDLELKPAN